MSDSNVVDTDFIVPDRYIVKSEAKNPIKTPIDKIYPDFVSNFNAHDYLRSRAILTLTNVVVDDIMQKFSRTSSVPFIRISVKTQLTMIVVKTMTLMLLFLWNI